MIAVDTNILVRLATRDHPRQAAQAQALLEDSFREEETCFVGDPVLCELEWVLARCYRASRGEILTALQDLFSKPQFEFEDRVRLRRVLTAYETGECDLADYLIGAKAHAYGARSTYTFDRALRDQEGFTVL